MNLSDDTYLISGDRQKIAPDIGTALSAMRAGLHRLGAFWIKRRTRAREMRELYRFSERDLGDIGLSRSDVWSIERGTFSRD
ncbi:DUF1127 domain-containing protein [Acidisphaera sp. S103]|uniref:DUF1127 domain-containing protein n=1 Tax=Acidisphaera sp. S103 TaxID=1747223 RepID=UPI00131BB1FE|nr:DUF1127 domain-containing protein [Acidisphaera sp. S103]